MARRKQTLPQPIDTTFVVTKKPKDPRDNFGDKRYKQPAHIVTKENQELVKALSSFGISREDIATYIGVSGSTIDKHYKKEMEIGPTAANAQIAKRLYKKAIDGDTTCMIFWLKCRARWKERNELALTDPDGKAVPFVQVYLPDNGR